MFLTMESSVMVGKAKVRFFVNVRLSKVLAVWVSALMKDTEIFKAPIVPFRLCLFSLFSTNRADLIRNTHVAFFSSYLLGDSGT